MPIFSLDHGRLNPARSTIDAESDIAAEALIAVRDQVTELLHQPFFPVAWLTEPPAAGQGSRHTSLVALEPSGQTVTIEVVGHLDADVLMASLARAGRHNDMSRGKLSGLYPRGVSAFRRDWQEFLDACPSLVDVGPRLIILCLDLSDDIRGAVDSLLGTGVQLFRISLIDTQGSVLVSLDEVRPHEASFRTIAEAASRVEITTGAGPSNVPTADSPFDEGEHAAPEPSPTSASSAYEDGEGDEVAEELGPREAGEAESGDEGGSAFDHVFSAPVVPTGAPTGPSGNRPTAPGEGSAPGADAGANEDAAPATAGADPVAERLSAPDADGPGDDSDPRGEGADEAIPRGTDASEESRLWRASAVAWRGGRVTMNEDVPDVAPGGATESESEGEADGPVGGPAVDPDLAEIARRHGEFTITFRSLRRRVNATATVTGGGIVFGERTYPGPDEAAEAAMGRPGDGWRVWKNPQGIKLAELRDRL